LLSQDSVLEHLLSARLDLRDFPGNSIDLRNATKLSFERMIKCVCQSDATGLGDLMTNYVVDLQHVCTDTSGTKLLHLIAAHDSGKCPVAKIFLERLMVDPNVFDKYGQTPLHKAAYHGNVLCIKQLLAAGANAGARNSSGQCAIDLACVQGYDAVVQALINQSVEAFKQENFLDGIYKRATNPLHTACAHGQNGVAAILTDTPWLHLKDAVGDTPLHFAVASGETDGLELCKVLVSAGANPHETNDAALTPTQMASRHKYLKLVALLSAVESTES